MLLLQKMLSFSGSQLAGFLFGFSVVLSGFFGLVFPERLAFSMQVNGSVPPYMFVKLTSIASFNMGVYYCLAALFGNSEFYSWTVPFRFVTVTYFLLSFPSLAWFELLGALATGYFLWQERIEDDFELSISIQATSNNIIKELHDFEKFALTNQSIKSCIKAADKNETFFFQEIISFGVFNHPVQFEASFQATDHGLKSKIFHKLINVEREITVYPLDDKTNCLVVEKSKLIVVPFLRRYALESFKRHHFKMLQLLKPTVEANRN